MDPQVTYEISLNPSRFMGYQSKNKQKGMVKIFPINIFNAIPDFKIFVEEIIYFTILERICLERGFQKIRIKNRCDPCKMRKYAITMYNWIFEMNDTVQPPFS